VVGIDNLNDSYDVRLKEWRLAQLLPEGRFRFYRLNILDREGLEKIFRTSHPTAVINLAARPGVRPSLDDPWVYYETNVTGALNLLELCRRFNVSKIVQASSSSVYGENPTQPFEEGMDCVRPSSPYAASKQASETLCHTYHYLYGMDITIFRYFTVYGPGGRPDMSPFRFVQWISEGRPVTVFGDGAQSRDFTYVGDIARGTVLGLKEVGYEIVNLGSDHPITLLDTIRRYEALLGKKAELRFEDRHPADVSATWADIGKARRILGWQPQTSFEEGSAELVKWYQDNRAWAKGIETGREP
jgi:nucleoside-diphosphate-sugar epimerase